MKSIEINGYKSIRNLKLDLKPINILIGANGSGKSNFLSFFTLLRNMYARNLQVYVALHGGMDDILFNGRKTTESIAAKLEFDTNAYSFTLQSGQESFIVTQEGLGYDKNPYCANTLEIASVGPESNLQFSTIPRATYIRDYIKALKRYHFHDTGKNSPLTKLSDVQSDKYELAPQGDNIAAFLYNIRQENLIVYNRIVKTIQSVAPYFGDFILIPNEAGKVMLQWEDKYGKPFGVCDLSDGTMRFVALTILFMQPTLPQTIIIDEPELGLHPFAIAKLAGMIHSAAARGCQVIAATQSTDLISHFTPEDIITVDQIKGESIYQRLSSEDLALWIEEYSIDDLWKRNIIRGGQPNNA